MRKEKARGKGWQLCLHPALAGVTKATSVVMFICLILLVVLDSVRLLYSVMMRVLSDKLFATNSLGAAICLKNAKCFVQHLSNMWTCFHKLRSSVEYCKT